MSKRPAPTLRTQHTEETCLTEMQSQREFIFPRPRGGRYRGSYGGRRVSHSSTTGPNPSPAPALGDLLRTISRQNLESSTDEHEKAEISGTEFVASYSWLNKTDASIAIPGAPPRWTPPLTMPHKVRPDDGEYYRDPNAAHYPKHPLEAAVVSVLSMHPEPHPVDLVACSSSLGNLLRFSRGFDEDQLKPFRILVEVIGNTVHLVRRENSPKERIPNVYGYGHTFPEAFTTWDHAVRSSTSHQRIIRYRFGGMDILLRFEADGFVPASKSDSGHDGAATESETTTHVESPAMEDQLTELEGLFVGTQASLNEEVTQSSLNISHAGQLVPQSAVFDLKTRSVKAHRDRNVLDEQLHRLWVTQLGKFILAWHTQGNFDDVQVKSVTDDVARWQETSQPTLKRLVSLLRTIVQQAREAGDGKLEIAYRPEGQHGSPLEIREQLSDAGAVLSGDVRMQWLAWLGDGSESETSSGPQQDADSPGNDDERYTDRDDDWYSSGYGYDSYDEKPDYTACDKECGYCGRCDY